MSHFDLDFGSRFGLFVLFRVKNRPPGVPVADSPTVRNSKKSIFTLLFHSKISGSGILRDMDRLEPTAELLRTYPEYLSAGRIACRHSSIEQDTTPSKVKNLLRLHSGRNFNLLRKFSRASSKFSSIPAFLAIMAEINRSSLRTPGASKRHLCWTRSNWSKKYLIFIHSIMVNFLCLVYTCQNVRVALFGRLFEEFQVRTLWPLAPLPLSDFSRMVNMEE